MMILISILSHNDNMRTWSGGGGGQFGNFYINFAQPLVVKILKEGMKEVGEKYDVNVN